MLTERMKSPITPPGAGGGVHKHDRQTHCEHPDGLEHPEDGKPQRIGSLVVKPVVLAYLDDPVQEVAGQPETPEDDGGGDDDLSPVVGVGHTQTHHSQDHKVGPASKVRHLQGN